MKGSMTAAAVHKQYEDGISALRRQIKDAALRQRFAAEADAFFRACALGGSGAGTATPLPPRHVEYYNAVYTKGNPVPSILFWELSTAVAEYPGFQPPAFLPGCGPVTGSRAGRLSRRFVDLMTLMLLLFAAVGRHCQRGGSRICHHCADTPACHVRPGRPEGGQGPSGRQRLHHPSVPPPPGRTRPPPAAQGGGAPQAQPPSSPGRGRAPPPAWRSSLSELDGLCGLEEVKKDVKSLINLVKVRKMRQEHNLPVPPMSLHLVFMGNPGTGKTTVARLLARIYHAIGVLSKGQLVEGDRSGLVAGFVGQTAIKTSEGHPEGPGRRALHR